MLTCEQYDEILADGSIPDDDPRVQEAHLHSLGCTHCQDIDLVGAELMRILNDALWEKWEKRTGKSRKDLSIYERRAIRDCAFLRELDDACAVALGISTFEQWTAHKDSCPQCQEVEQIQDSIMERWMGDTPYAKFWEGAVEHGNEALGLLSREERWRRLREYLQRKGV
ncbi:hypothetical protein HYW17_00420 [Candidatus Uhrbacteria bacterium]|nr:hypothetical protein [Candidatus Uhrbacteria bacterium]